MDPKLKIMLVHNGYIHEGGEDVVVQRDIDALRQEDVELEVFVLKSKRSTPDYMASLGAPFNQGYMTSLLNKMDSWRPDIIHSHNLFPLLSPRLYEEASKRGIASVQSFHNFRPFCLNGLFMTPEKETCERCAGGNYYHGVVRGCYRGSYIQSLGMAVHLNMARYAGWYGSVDAFITPNQFVKRKYQEYGFPGNKMHVLPHFLPDANPIPVAPAESYVLYVGRLSEEKGLRWLIDLFQKGDCPAPLYIAGRGPLEAEVQAAQCDSIRYLGFLSDSDKQQYLQKALALVMASECYENFPLTMIEANALGVPTLVPDFGGMAELVTPNTGRAYVPHDMDSFIEQLQDMLESFSGLNTRQICQEEVYLKYSKKTVMAARLRLYKELVGACCSKENE